MSWVSGLGQVLPPLVVPHIGGHTIKKTQLVLEEKRGTLLFKSNATGASLRKLFLFFFFFE